MEKIMEQYGGIIWTAVAITAFVVILKLFIGTDATSVVYQAFSNVFTSVFSNSGL